MKKYEMSINFKNIKVWKRLPADFLYIGHFNTLSRADLITGNVQNLPIVRPMLQCVTSNSKIRLSKHPAFSM